MELREAIRTRRSIRKYKDKHVEWDKIATILDAGRLAPTAGNIQNWKFITVQKETSKKKIAKACLGQDWISTAPAIIAVTAEPMKAHRFYGIRGERLYTIQNCAAAIQNMLLTAHDLGLGACWVSAFDEELMASALILPEQARTYAVIPIGYPAEKPEQPPKYRIEHVVWFENWGNKRRIPKYGQYSVEVKNHVDKGKTAFKKLAETLKKQKK